MVTELILQANQYSQRCEELFTLALGLFKRLAETSLDFIKLDDAIRQWSSLLLYDYGPEDVRISPPIHDLGSRFYRMVVVPIIMTQ